MKKLAKRSFKGIEYIRLSSLSLSHADKLAKSLNSRTIIKIQMQDSIIDDCVLYHAYEDWFNNYSEEPVTQTAVTGINESVSLT